MRCPTKYRAAKFNIIRRCINVLKRILHVLLEPIEEISIRERLKVSVLGGRIWISFIRIKIYPVGIQPV